MHIQYPTTDPTRGEDVTGLAYVSRIVLDYDRRWGQITYGVYSAATGVEPLRTVTLDLTPTGRPARYGPAPLLDPGSPPVYQTDPETGDLVLDPETGEPVLLDPGSPPTYGEPPLLHPALPSFPEIVASHPELVAALGGLCYQIALGQPEFPGAALVPDPTDPPPEA